MNVITISTDRQIFNPASPVGKRMVEYGTLVNELHVIVFARKDTGKPISYQLSPNVWVYRTNSVSRFSYGRDARRLGAGIIKDRNFSAPTTIVSTQDPFETGIVGLFLKRRFGLRLQVQIHTDFLSPYFSAFSLGVIHSVLNRVRIRLARRVLPEANQIRVVSKRIKELVLRRYPAINSEIIAVLPIYTNTEHFAAEPSIDLHTKYPQFSTIILMCSRLAPEKNILLALRVFKKVLTDSAAILSKTFSIGLIIVGDGPEKQRLQALAAELEIHHSVIFEPWTNNLVSYYKTADIFLTTSLYEGYGLTFIEAGLSGIPVVTSDVGIAGDLLINEKNALVCPVNDANCFAQNITKLIADSNLQDTLATALRVEVKAVALSKEAYLQDYKKLFDITLHYGH